MEAAQRIDLNEIVEQIQMRQRLMLTTTDKPVPSAEVIRMTPPVEKHIPGEKEMLRTLDLLLGAGLELRDGDEKVRQAEARVLAAEEQIRIIQARAESAERRVDELESWMRKIFDTASENLSAR